MGWLVFSITNIFQFLMFSYSSSSGGDDGRGGGDDGRGGGDDGRGDDGGCLHPQMLAGFRLWDLRQTVTLLPQ